MKNFTKRERRIIGAVYHDCERIALERYKENQRERFVGLDRVKTTEAGKMAKYLASLFYSRKAQILKYGCDLPRKRYRL